MGNLPFARLSLMYALLERKKKNSRILYEFIGMLNSPDMYALVGVWITASIIQNQCRHQHAILSFKDLVPLYWICWYSETDQRSANCCSFWW